MSDGDEIAEKARRLAREQAFTPRRFLADLERGLHTEVELHTLPDEDRALLLPALRAMAGTRGGRLRLDAGRALFELNDPLGCEVLVDCLPSISAARHIWWQSAWSSIFSRSSARHA